MGQAGSFGCEVDLIGWRRAGDAAFPRGEGIPVGDEGHGLAAGQYGGGAGDGNGAATARITDRIIGDCGVGGKRLVKINDYRLSGGVTIIATARHGLRVGRNDIDRKAVGVERIGSGVQFLLVGETVPVKVHVARVRSCWYG